MSDAEELLLGLNPLESDTDGDGINDDVEVAYGSDPTDPTDPPCVYPAAPGTVSATDGTVASGVLVSWPAVTGVDEYQVFRSTSANDTNPTALSGWITETEYADTTAACHTNIGWPQKR